LERWYDNGRNWFQVLFICFVPLYTLGYKQIEKNCAVIVLSQQNQENLYLHFYWSWVRDHQSICITLECHLGSQHLSLNSGKEQSLFQFIWGTYL